MLSRRHPPYAYGLRGRWLIRDDTPRRGDPNTGARGRGDMSDWPRNGALLRGVKHDVNGTPWLEVGARAPAIRLACETIASSSRRVL